MLSDEEREALQYFNTETKTEAMHYGAVLVKLIEKQSKEIERLEKKVKRYEKIIEHKDEKCEQLLEFVETEKETDYVSKDKIKAKIEEIKNECKYCNFTDEICQELLQNNNCTQGNTLKVLQSLLEKE